MRACLTIERGEGNPPVADLDPATATTLGRSRDNTVVLQDEHVSRQHAEICFQNGKWVIRDFGALNGTRIDGKPIQQQAVLQHGQEIGIADMRLRFTVPDALLPVPPTRLATTRTWSLSRPNTVATASRVRKGTWVEVRSTSRPPESSQPTHACVSRATWPIR